MAVEPGDALFVSKLDEEGKVKVRDEINEKNDKDRELAVQALRQWVLQQKWLKTPTDFGFLLRFVRGKKYSQLLARQQLTNYWTARTKSPQLFGNIDPFDPKLIQVIKSGTIVVPKARDKYGRRVMWQRCSPLEASMVKEWGPASMYRAAVMISDWLNRDENTQVHGLVFIVDFTGITMSMFMSMWYPEYEKATAEFFQDALPGRLKGVHMYNEPTFFDAIYVLFSPFMKQKMKDRMKLHGRNVSKLYDELGMEVIPDEYLPDDYTGPSAGPLNKVSDELLAELQAPEFVEYVKEHTSDKYGVDIELKKNEPQAPVASFRKLNVD